MDVIIPTNLFFLHCHPYFILQFYSIIFILALNEHPQIILPKLLQRLSGLLSFLAAALARKYVSKSSLCHIYECNMACIFKPQVIFTRKNDLYQKLIALQKHDGHTYNASFMDLILCIILLLQYMYWLERWM